jgi:hypothetical protein
MKISIGSFADAGILDKERVIFKVLEDEELGDYALLLAKSGPEHPLAGRQISYWFANTDVKKDDLVIVYTKKGVQKTKDLGDGKTAHFFYWGLDSAAWGDDKHQPVLLYAEEWASKRVPSFIAE